MVYVSDNLCVGWLVVFATALLMSFAMIRAFQTRDHFTLGFAATGCVWLITWLGFAIETPTPAPDWKVRPKIASVMNFGREWQERDSSIPKTYAHYHDLYISGLMETQQPVVPKFQNSIRLFICLTSLVVGLLGGIGLHLRKMIVDKKMKKLSSGPVSIDAAA